MLDKDEIYICYLISISPNAIIDPNKTKKENITNAVLLPMRQIMVQPTDNSNYVQEIITEQLIPIYRITEKENIINKQKCSIEYSIPNSPYFIKYTVKKCYGKEPSNTLIKASKNEIKTYINNYASTKEKYNQFQNDLEQIFIEAEENYNSAINNNKQKKIKRIIKDLRRTIKSYE